MPDQKDSSHPNFARQPVEKKRKVACRVPGNRLNLGEVRWWFTYPFFIDEEACDRRGGRRFGCKERHNLTYESRQESHIYDGLYGLIAGAPPAGLLLRLSITSITSVTFGGYVAF